MDLSMSIFVYREIFKYRYNMNNKKRINYGKNSNNNRLDR